MWDAKEALLALAKAGNRDALKSLHTDLVLACLELQDLANSQPNLVGAVAKQSSYWPVALSPDEETKKKVLSLLDTLGVATATPERIRGRCRTTKGQKQIFRHIVGKYAIWLGNALLALNENIPLSVAVRSDPAGWPKWPIAAGSRN